MNVKAELDRRLRALARLEGDPHIRKQLLADADSIEHGVGRLSTRQAELARKLQIR